MIPQTACVKECMHKECTHKACTVKSIKECMKN